MIWPRHRFYGQACSPIGAQEREIISVANLTREDARAFHALAPRVGLNLSTKPYRHEAANEMTFRMDRFQGAAVLVP